MITNDIEQIAPSEADLTLPIRIPCTQLPCSSIFPNSGQLRMHLLRHHKVASNKDASFNSERRFFCPRHDCKYNISASRHFRSMQMLRQHFLKVHAEKTLFCPKCPAGFASKTLLNAHTTHCGNSFRCATCDWEYGSHEALSTHCRRKKHQLPGKSLDMESSTKKPKNETNSRTTQTQIISDADQTSVFLDLWQKRATQSTLVQTHHLDSPKSDSAVNLNHLSFAGASFENSICEENICHIETQTDFTKQIEGNGDETNTGMSPMIYTDTQTQTQFDEFFLGLTNEIKIEGGLTHIETQTCWSPDFADLLNCVETQTADYSEKRTQTLKRIESRTTQTKTTQSTLVQTQDNINPEQPMIDTETNVFATNSVNAEINLNNHNFTGDSFEISFPDEDNLCHIETQTDFANIDETIRLSPITYADTHTQTQCDEFLLGWTHIETQTPSWSTMQTQTMDYCKVDGIEDEGLRLTD